MYSLKDVIALGIRIEQNGAGVYRDLQSRTAVPALRPLLEWLALEEEQHAVWFEALAADGRFDKETEDIDRAARTVLENIIGDRTFSLDDADPGSLKTETDILRLALEFEKDTLLFYETLRGFLEDDPASREQMASIILEEQRHILVLEEYLQKGTFNLFQQLGKSRESG